MKVLITGGYGYLGAHIAKKFVDENNDVSVLAPYSSNGNEKYYKIEATDSECGKVFEANSFDTVIYISESLNSPGSSNGSRNGRHGGNGNHISGLINIANLSAEKKVNKFIFISSSAIYGNTGNISAATEDSETVITGSGGVKDILGEYYCNKFSRSSKLNITILRISDFYGPGQFAENPNGNKDNFNISSVINDIIRDRAVEIDVPERKTFDFIYIEDAVDAVFKVAMDKSIKGVFNISSNTETTLSGLLDIISDVKKPKKIVIKETKNSMQMQRSWIDNTKIKKMTGWHPMVELREGINKTFEWQVENSSTAKSKTGLPAEVTGVEEKKQKKTAGKNLLTVIENLLLFLIFAFLQYGELFFNIKMPDVVIDYMIIYIILVGIIWGQVQAYIAMLLASALFIGASIFSGVDVITFLYTPSNLILLALYLLVGIITGYAIEKKNRDIISKDIAYGGLTGKYMFLLNIYNQTKVIKNELENQVIDAEDSFSTIYKTIQEVDSLEIERVFSGSISAIERIMKTDKVSIYITGSNGNKDFIRLKARSFALADKIPNSIKVSEFSQMKEVIDKKRMYVNRALQAGVPVMIAPVSDGNEVLAVIVIHDTGFDNLTANYENLFRAVTGLVSNAVKRAYFFEKSLSEKRYLFNTRILVSEVFENVLSEVRRNRDELGMSYALLEIKDCKESHKSVSDKVTSGIRENDYIGISKDNRIYVLLSNTNNNYAGLVIDRLGEKGVRCELVEEEMLDEYE